MISPQPSVTSNLPDSSFSRTQTFSGRYVSLADIASFVRLAAQDAGLSDFAVYMVETAVDEACSNIIEHAYKGENVGNIEITCQNHPQNLTILIRDWGHSFKPESIPDPDLRDNLDNLPGHGLGLFFMRKWMDEVSFQFGAGSNLLTLVKKKETKP
jgi:serine/threonine-protein kinase RsbW